MYKHVTIRPACFVVRPKSGTQPNARTHWLFLTTNRNYVQTQSSFNNAQSGIASDKLIPSIIVSNNTVEPQTTIRQLMVIINDAISISGFHNGPNNGAPVPMDQAGPNHAMIQQLIRYKLHRDSADTLKHALTLKD